MGSWGSGNFDNDDSLEWYVAQLGRDILAKIRATVVDDLRLEPDDTDSIQMVCAVEVLAALDKAVHPILPYREEVVQWRDACLRVFDSFVARADHWNRRFAQDRRVAINRAFSVAIRRARPSAASPAKGSTKNSTSRRSSGEKGTKDSRRGKKSRRVRQ